MGFTGFLIAITIVCFLLILAIMVQNPKGGGLSSDFGGQQLGGVQKTNDFVEKATWTLAAVIMVGAIAVSSMMKPAVVKDNSTKATEQPRKGAPQAPAAPGK